MAHYDTGQATAGSGSACNITSINSNNCEGNSDDVFRVTFRNVEDINQIPKSISEKQCTSHVPKDCKKEFADQGRGFPGLSACNGSQISIENSGVTSAGTSHPSRAVTSPVRNVSGEGVATVYVSEGGLQSSENDKPETRVNNLPYVANLTDIEHRSSPVQTSIFIPPFEHVADNGHLPVNSNLKINLCGAGIFDEACKSAGTSVRRNGDDIFECQKEGISKVDGPLSSNPDVGFSTPRSSSAAGSTDTSFPLLDIFGSSVVEAVEKPHAEALFSYYAPPTAVSQSNIQQKVALSSLVSTTYYPDGLLANTKDSATKISPFGSHKQIYRGTNSPTSFVPSPIFPEDVHHIESSIASDQRIVNANRFESANPFVDCYVWNSTKSSFPAPSSSDNLLLMNYNGKNPDGVSKNNEQWQVQGTVLKSSASSWEAAPSMTSPSSSCPFGNDASSHTTSSSSSLVDPDCRSGSAGHLKSVESHLKPAAAAQEDDKGNKSNSLGQENTASDACDRMKALINGANGTGQEYAAGGAAATQDSDKGVSGTAAGSDKKNGRECAVDNHREKGSLFVDIRPYGSRIDTDEGHDVRNDKIYEGDKYHRRTKSHQNEEKQSVASEKYRRETEKEHSLEKEISHQETEREHNAQAGPSLDKNFTQKETAQSEVEATKSSSRARTKIVIPFNLEEKERASVSGGNNEGSQERGGLEVSRIRREQSVEELLAAVQRLDRTVDHLCEMSVATASDQTLFLGSSEETLVHREVGGVSELAKSFLPGRISPDRDCSTTEMVVRPEQPPSCMVNETLREFAAIHELCQASSSSRYKPETNESKQISDDCVKTEPNDTAKKCNSGNDQSHLLIESTSNHFEFKDNIENKATEASMIINEAINRNCSFPSIEAIQELHRPRSSKRNHFTDDSHSNEGRPDCFSEHHTMTNSIDTQVNVDASKLSTSHGLAGIEDQCGGGDDTDETGGLVGAVTNAVRRSLRRVKRLRNSFGKSRRGDREVGSEERENSRERGERRSGSEEWGERRVVPEDPRIGLPSVRSPATAALLLPALVASLGTSCDEVSTLNQGSPRRVVDLTSTHRIPEPRETLTPPPSSPYYRRDHAFRPGGPLLPGAPPPLSPSRHIPPNLSGNSFRIQAGATSPTSPTSPQRQPGDVPSSRSSRTLPSNPPRSSALYNLTSHPSLPNGFVAPVVSLSSRSGEGEPPRHVLRTLHVRSSSAPREGSSSISSDASAHPSGTGPHTDLAAVLISPSHLPSHNTRSSSSNNRNSSSNSRATTSPSRTVARDQHRGEAPSRTTSPRRNDRSSSAETTRSTTNESRPRSATGRRRGDRPTTRGGPQPSASPSHSVTSERSTSNNAVSSNPSAATTSEPASPTENGRTSSRAGSRPCSRTSTSQSSSATIITDPGGRSSSSTAGDNNNNNSRAEGSSHRRRQSSESVAEDIDPWPHHHSGLMASLSLTVTVFNISRFAVLGAAFGWPFLVQWILVSLVLGLPLLTLHAALGQHTGLGPLQLWRVAPIFQGVGVSLVVAQAVLGVYCSVPVAWLFVYFRDSFISHKSAFTWSSCWKVAGMNCTGDMNLSQILPQSIPSYLSWQVQHRTVGATWEESLGSINFNLAFYVPLIWLVTLLVLCKGNRVYGRLSYVLFIVPLLCFLAVCIYVASWTRDDLSLVPDFARAFMNSRSWVAASREVFLVWGIHGPALQQMTVHNRRGQSVKGHIWLVVVTTVLVLVLAAVTGSCCAASFSLVGLKYSPSSFETPESAQFLVPLHDSSSIESTDPVQSNIRTSSNALAPNAGVWGDITSPRFAREGRNVDDGIPDLYERMILLASQLMDSYLRYDSLYAGIRISYPQFGNHHSRLFNGMRRLDPDHPALGPIKRPLGGVWTTPRPARSESPPDPSRSGYQALRLATELFPAFVGVHGVDKIQTFWPFLFYLSLLLFGIGQQVAVWRCVVEVVISSAGLQKRRVLATACCCLLGLSAALPLTTQLGPDLLFFLDYVIGCGWWLMILQLVQVFSLLFVRGKPVSAQDLVSSVGGTRQGSGVPGWSVHVAAFACSILVPVGLLVLAISSFKSGHYREVFAWSSPGYWPVWASQLASALQLLPILLVPVVALAQTCRYLAKTRYDVFLRIQLLYRPAFSPRMTYPRPPTPPLAPSREDGEAGNRDPAYMSTTPNSPLPFSDPPPKYTPPPSYSTATGMGIAKALNQSVRRSIRHIRSSLRLSEYPVLPSSAPQPSNAAASSPISHSGVWTTTQEPYIPPVDYIADLSSVQDPYIPPADYVTGTIESTAQTSTQDPPPLYSTLDPVARKKVLKVLQRAGIRRNHSHSQRHRSGGDGRNRDPEEGALVSPPQTTMELQGMDHLAYEHEMV